MSGSLVPGRMGREMQYFSVKLVYVLYPGTMLVLSSFLFIFTMWRTRRLPTWKNSPLPLLYHGFELPPGYQATELSNLAYMEQASRAQYVVLQDHDDGLGFKLRST
ncbi:hypothetical protein ColTof4_12979 [Colletotrichum tofieldiae]|nr:hypothetical protein ColTof3_00385 [Colletotrichum tofieldiae]GKT80556.1 hypothetical protein ColTof4_12979 [Colletotrichum tofieldiae]GKT88677.1 hypothetical protein Ct61P_06527 [Colletotrichum tofieldiae]